MRYKRNVQESSGEEEESQVGILEEEEHHADLGPQRAGPHTQNKPAANNRRRLKAAAVTLGGFFLLILAALFIYFTLLQTRYDQLSNNYSQLQDEVKQLKNRTEVTLLQTRYDQLSNNYTQLQDDVMQLKNRTEDTICPDGWTRYGCSCYFKSKEKKKWEDSRDDCQQRGAYLVVINSKEDQKFVTELSKDGESWIGILNEMTRWIWHWVDGSVLPRTYWPESQDYDGQVFDYYDTWHASTCCDQQGKWIRVHGRDDLKNWICEKKIN
ncbi:CD209 antigen-like protein E isoform X2 [Etheostoma spectabile]|uniref:CD209 antigen-like protein E isoform X2 n=1 Tax=Etheostoma spectabile TaxID=54343 RepID=UPI0013AE9880|nr:CD209 antigen-like protein E isoform X2 [Etheostoma spectabile]XP_032367614.1 CD209 antigen-like protein E isoform X2 [Etheostoma spectabile]